MSESGLTDIARRLSELLGIDMNTALEMLKEWQRDGKNMLNLLENEEKKVELAKKTKKRGLVPIWRCGVCGRANMPYIACYVQPYIVRYEERDFS